MTGTAEQHATAPNGPLFPSGFYSRSEWRHAIVLFIAYVVVAYLSAQVLPPAARLYPANAIALSTLFFGGLRLWPVAYLAALTAGALTGVSFIPLVLQPAITTLAAVIGAYLLRITRMDPLFRRYRDTANFLLAVFTAALVSPAIHALIAALSKIPFTPLAAGHDYVATLICFLVGTPFLLRWFTKPRFARRPWEILETVIVFAVLLLVEYGIFSVQGQQIAGVPLVYILLIPLSWIALRLRPRFLTLALLTLTVLAIGNIITTATPSELPAQLFSAELLLIVLSVVFFIVVSLEEDRRVNLNLLHSQLGTLENAVARVVSESNAKNDFIAILAHELRNPLAPIMSAIDLLKLKGARDPEDEQAFAIMEDRMQTVRRLLDDLLDISRIAEGKILIKRETVDVRMVARQSILSTDHYRAERHQSLVFREPAEPLCVVGDAVRIEQICSNLLANASKYSDAGDTVTLTLQERGDMAEIEVADEGIGINAAVIEEIFTPFRQEEQGERSKRGLGIGLALVRSFAEMHGGSVTAHSEGRGHGSRFRVLLPLAPAGTITDAVPAEPERTFVPSSTEERGPQVLVVDDNDAAAGGIGRLLELLGCTVAYAYDGRQAIAKALTMQPNLMLADIGLPDMDGYAVAARLREKGFTGRLVALSGYSTPEARGAGMAAGFDDYLVKPAGINDLRRVLSELG